MVHALKEAHRILVPRGIMIDIRPLSVNVPLEVLYAGGRESAGIIDMSPEVQSDISSGRAIETVMLEGIYKELMVEYFDFALYWKTVKGMEDDIEENWKDEVIITKETWKRARVLVNQRLPKTQIRMALRMKLGLYEKQG